MNKDYRFLNKNCRICITGGSGFIGSNLIKVIKSISSNNNILNLDLNKPKNKLHIKYWKKCDLNKINELKKIIEEFNPKYIIHLAAEAKMNGSILEKDFRTNIKGVKNLLNIVKNLPNNSYFIAASSQHVKKPGSFIYDYKNDSQPLGLYGKSKVITESLIKNAGLKNNWFIIRPTLVWGPGNLNMAETIFKYIKKNIYYHPRIDNTVRSYGYVDNVCYQILKLCTLDATKIEDRVFYVADFNILQKEWISLAFKFFDKKKVNTVPTIILKILSYFGDIIRKLFPKFPLYTERFLNLTTSNPVPLDKTYYYLGLPKVGLHEGMENTVKWLKSYYLGKIKN